jgi:hypothetical protein
MARVVVILVMMVNIELSKSRDRMSIEFECAFQHYSIENTILSK